MFKDRYGNTLSTSSPSAHQAYLQGMELLFGAGAGAVEAFRRATQEDEGFALAHAALARTLQIEGRAAEASAAFSPLAQQPLQLTARERSHVAVFEKLISGAPAAAFEATRVHLAAWPRDAMVLAPSASVFGLIGFSGREGREQEQLEFLTQVARHYGDDPWFLSMLAFAEIELGLLEPGRRHVERALEGAPNSGHTAHVYAHLHYELGERDAGLAWLRQWLSGYSRAAQLHCHLSWHAALWALETGSDALAWQIYADAVQPGAAWGPPLNVVSDSSAFLLRMTLAGFPVDAGHWVQVADYARHHFSDSKIPFARLHLAIAYALSEDTDGVSTLCDDTNTPVVDMLRPIARGFQALAQTNWQGAVSALRPQLTAHERLGGSRAQRDLLEYAVAYSLVRMGKRRDAQALLTDRRPSNGSGRFPVAGIQASPLPS